MKNDRFFSFIIVHVFQAVMDFHIVLSLEDVFSSIFFLLNQGIFFWLISLNWSKSIVYIQNPISVIILYVCNWTSLTSKSNSRPIRSRDPHGMASIIWQHYNCCRWLPQFRVSICQWQSSGLTPNFLFNDSNLIDSYACLLFRIFQHPVVFFFLTPCKHFFFSSSWTRRVLKNIHLPALHFRMSKM